MTPADFSHQLRRYDRAAVRIPDVRDLVVDGENELVLEVCPPGEEIIEGTVLFTFDRAGLVPVWLEWGPPPAGSDGGE